MEVQSDRGAPGESYDLEPSDPRTLAGEAAATGSLATLAALSQLPELVVGPIHLHAAIKDHDQEVMIGAGLRTFGGGATLGRAHPYRLLRFTPGVRPQTLHARAEQACSILGHWMRYILLRAAGAARLGARC